MQQDLAVVVKNTDVHGAGMHVDATGKLVLFRVESHEVSSSCVRERFPSASIPQWYAEGEASIIINSLEQTGDSVGFSPVRESVVSPAAQARR
jgi:hypothetical protein